MDNTLYDRIYAEIVEYDTIIIHRHVRPDPDALGSQLGLKKLISGAFPNKKVYAVGQDVENLRFIGTMDKVDNEIYNNALVIITDTANRPRIDGKRFDKGQKNIKIDHHPDEDEYGDISLVDTSASSCSEIIADFSFHLGDKLPMTDEAARLLYCGIIGDTGRFLYPATTPKTMRIVARLMEYNFSASEMGQMMNTNSRKSAQLSGYVLQNVEINERGVAHVILTRAVLEKFGAEDSDTAPVVPLPGTIEGVICWGIFVEQENGGFRCRLRSKGPVINEVAKRYGGGGHALASGANAQNSEEIAEIIREFDTLVEEWKK